MKIILFAMLALAAGLGSDNISHREMVRQIIKGMTTREKVAQLVMIAFESYQSPEAKARQDSLVAGGIGGIIIMNDSLKAGIDRINELQSHARLPLIVAIDGEWGVAMRFKEYPAFPRQVKLGRLGSDSLVYEMGRAIGSELKDLKIYVNFAPVVDVNVNPGNQVLRSRSFGPDKEKVALLGSAYARGMQDVGVTACAKHFPGHGDTSVDSHKGLPVLDFTRERIDSLELYPFKRLIADSVQMVMIGHLAVPVLDRSGAPASVSHRIVTGLLRRRMGFDGVIVTDALEMKGVLQFFDGSGPKTCLAAYKAGVDFLLMPREPQKCIDLITSEIDAGRLSRRGLDDKVYRVLMLKASKGMLDPFYDRYVHIEDVHVDANRELIDELNFLTNTNPDEKDSFRVPGVLPAD